jgi:hypothetical protein
VICITKTNRYDPHERIHEVGLSNGNRLTVARVLMAIDRGDTFHVTRGGRRVAVIAAQHLYKRYIKTKADGIQPNNLLELPECI